MIKEKLDSLLDRDSSSYSVIRRLICNHVKPYTRYIFLALMLMSVCAACSAALVQMVKPAIDEIFLTKNRDMLILIPIVTFALSAVKGVTEFFQNYIVRYIGQRILTDLQMLMYEHLLKADINFIQKQSSGRIISRFTNDIAMMRSAVSNALVGCAKHLLTVVLLIALMFQLEPFLSVFVFLIFPIAIYPIQKIGRKMRNVAHNTQEALGDYISRLDETFQSIKTVKSYMMEEEEVARARTVTEKILDLYRKSAKFDSLTSPIMEFISGIAMASIILYGGMMIIDGKTTTGSLFAFITAFVSAYRPYKSLVSLNTSLQEGIAASKRLFQVLDEKPMIQDNQHAADITFHHPNICFDDVSLSFDTKRSLNGVSFEIPYGKTTAIVGRSGSGKTSLANILSRFYQPDSGAISIEGHNILDIKISSIRKQVAFVSQEVMLFDTTVAHNISYGTPNASIDDIIRAAKHAGADEFIVNLPHGYDTNVGAHGHSLSGGQRQRISIARAFLKNSPILIMDEATSALDAKSELIIRQSLKSTRKDRTTIIITHRLHTIIDSDMIVVFKDGAVVERGTHDELLNMRGEYYQLFTKDIEQSDYIS